MTAAKGMDLDLPCGVFYNLNNVILDLNGTITVDGKMLEGVCERLKEISKALDVYIVTADTNETMDSLAKDLSSKCNIKIHRLETGRGDLQKLAFLEELGRENTVAIGNGCNDALMLKESALGICIMGKEGTSVNALLASKVAFFDICDALDIFLKPNRLIATLRK